MTHHTDDGKPPSTDRNNTGSAGNDDNPGLDGTGIDSAHTGSHHTSPDGGPIDIASSPGLST